MTTEGRIRNWMKIVTKQIPTASPTEFRQARLEDAQKLSILMDHAYRGTIDHEGETLEQCLDEMQGTLTGRYGPFLDFASFVIAEQDRIISASLVTIWKEKPLLAFSMTDPSHQGKGYAGFLIERSITALAEKDYPHFYLVVTHGNDPAERLYRRLGFDMIGPALPKQPPPTE